MGVPAAYIREGELQSQVRLDQLGDLHQAQAQAAPGVLRAVLRIEEGRVGLLETLDRLETFRGRAGQEPGRGAVVEVIEGSRQTFGPVG